MSTKNERQEMLIRLIKENEISTQEELTALMKEKGFPITQATCSRDIKDLGIIKVTVSGQTTKYAVLDRTGEIAPGRLLAVFSNSLLSCSSAMNLVVVRTLPGMAQAALGVQPALDGQVNFEVRVNNNVPSSRINKWQIRFGQAATIRTNNGKLYTDLRVLGVNISKDEDFFTISIGAKAPTIINEIERRTR